ncbi:MAG: serpin family protein [Candidatus Micrarchaeaceae archaeon]
MGYAGSHKIWIYAALAALAGIALFLFLHAASISFIAANTLSANAIANSSTSSAPAMPAGQLQETHDWMQMSSSMGNFSFSAYAYLANASQGNILFSPFSLYGALAMAASGARGTTYSQFASVLGLGNISSAGMGFAYLLHAFAAPQNPYYAICINNAAWIENNYPVKNSFLSNLSYYNASVYSADFGNPLEYKAINSWISNHTFGKITDLFSSPLSSQTKLILINTVYFKGAWSVAFDANLTKQRNFYLANGSAIKVPMMNNMFYENAFYFNDSLMQALMLNYKGGNLSMLILLPNSNASLQDAAKSLASMGMPLFISRLRSFYMINASLPRFSFTTESMDLNKMLESMGITNAFSGQNANFTGIVNATYEKDNGNLYISKVVQKAYIEVNETGTTAAAATGVEVGATSVASPAPLVTFNADHPFIFFIVDRHTGAILFMGKVENPLAQ